MDFPRIVDPAVAFDSLVDWIHDKMVVKRKAPGAIIGLSGTDSIVVFLATYKAFARACMADRVWGVHFEPSDDFLDDHPEAEAHLWFGTEVVPWLREQAPKAKVTISRDIDWRMDGVRWGMLNEMGAVDYEHGRRMREHSDRYWVVGTRNRSEDILFTYSNASLLASFQPLVRLWKSEVLQVSKHLGVPQLAIDKSCDVDCICGRQRLPAHHIREVDLILMARVDDLDLEYLERHIDPELGTALSTYVHTQIQRSCFKSDIPYVPGTVPLPLDPLVKAFDDLSLDLRGFDHRKHVQVAAAYLKAMPFEEAVSRYLDRLLKLLTAAGAERKYSVDITRKYFAKIDQALKDGTSLDSL
jgi:NH3-dependent NAD+ synthetase